MGSTPTGVSDRPTAGSDYITQAYDVRIDPSDSILSLSERLAKYGGGGTDCSIPLHQANTKYRKRPFGGCVLVSDNESWIYRNRPYAYGRAGSTGVMAEWQQFVKNQQRLGVTAPKLVCIDIQPYGSTQAPERDDRHGRILAEAGVGWMTVLRRVTQLHMIPPSAA